MKKNNTLKLASAYLLCAFSLSVSEDTKARNIDSQAYTPVNFSLVNFSLDTKSQLVKDTQQKQQKPISPTSKLVTSNTSNLLPFTTLALLIALTLKSICGSRDSILHSTTIMLSVVAIAIVYITAITTIIVSFIKAITSAVQNKPNFAGGDNNIEIIEGDVHVSHISLNTEQYDIHSGHSTHSTYSACTSNSSSGYRTCEDCSNHSGVIDLHTLVNCKSESRRLSELSNSSDRTKTPIGFQTTKKSLSPGVERIDAAARGRSFIARSPNSERVDAAERVRFFIARSPDSESDSERVDAAARVRSRTSRHETKQKHTPRQNLIQTGQFLSKALNEKGETSTMPEVQTNTKIENKVWSATSTMPESQTNTTSWSKLWNCCKRNRTSLSPESLDEKEETGKTSTMPESQTNTTSWFCYGKVLDNLNQARQFLVNTSENVSKVCSAWCCDESMLLGDAGVNEHIEYVSADEVTAYEKYYKMPTSQTSTKHSNIGQIKPNLGDSLIYF